MKTENITMQFRAAHSCVIFTNDKSAATGRKMPKLYIQSIDEYGYQRELTIQFRYEPGDSGNCYWESHIYMHPGRRAIAKLGKSQAENVILRIISLARDYPDLLFNVTSSNRPRNAGFVRFAEQLHRGALPSANML
jgi:hypothetical protein